MNRCVHPAVGNFIWKFCVPLMVPVTTQLPPLTVALVTLAGASAVALKSCWPKAVQLMAGSIAARSVALASAAVVLSSEPPQALRSGATPTLRASVVTWVDRQRRCHHGAQAGLMLDRTK